MGAPNQVTIEDFPAKFVVGHRTKFYGQEEKLVVTSKADLKSMMDAFEARSVNPMKRPDNIDKFKDVLHGQDTSFKGGTYRGLFEPRTDIQRFKRAERKLKANKLYKKLAFTFDKANARKRVRSAYDGDYDFDKKWDLEPFSTRSKGLLSVKIVKLYVSLSFSAGVSSKTIDDYGAMVIAIIKLIEKSGAMVELYVTNTGRGFCDGDGYGEDSGTVYHQVIKIKKPDEYIPVQKLLRVFQSNFMRRVLFAGIVASAEIAGKDVKDSLGRPYAYGKCWEIKDDKLYIFSVPDLKQQYKIIENLLSMLNPKGDEND